jgi:hypothetical protein
MNEAAHQPLLAVSGATRNRYESVVLTLILVIGIFFPTSLGGESREFLIGIALVLLLAFFSLFIYWRGTRPGAIFGFSIPILVVLLAGTLISCAFRFGGTIFCEYVMIATLFALNLRRLRMNRLVTTVFLLVNILWIIGGAVILVGNEAFNDQLVKWYSQFYADLVPGMLALHKPVLTFGSHSLAGFFTYLFFWLNWETYRRQHQIWNLIFALCELVLLLGMTSFTSMGFAVLAVAQIGYWLWKKDRLVFVVCAASVAVITWLTVGMITDELEILWKNPSVASSVLNADNSGFMVRYAVGGTVFGTINYIWEHPLAPIGFTYPSTVLYLGDSGPVEYLLRGSIPLLLLVYLGLYKFLRHNVRDRNYALALFIFFIGFETGYNTLPYFRTLYLLPFVAVYLNQIGPQQEIYVAAS